MHKLYILLGLLILGLVSYGIYVYTTDGWKKQLLSDTDCKAMCSPLPNGGLLRVFDKDDDGIIPCKPNAITGKYEAC